MSFIKTWHQQIVDKAKQVGFWLDQRRQNDLPPLVYGHLAGLTLLPVAAAAGDAFATGQPLSLSIGMALGSVLSGIGGNLVATRIEQWSNGSAEFSLDATVQWATELAASSADFRTAVDNLLTEFEVIQHVQANLSREQQAWFLETLQAETQALNSTLLVVVTEMRRTADASEATASYTERAAGALDKIQSGVEQIADHLTKTADPLSVAIEQYQRKLLRECNQLTDLVALSLDTDDLSNVTLDQVYIDLDTTDVIDIDEDKEEQRRQEKQMPLPMLTAAAEAQRLVILGDPGSGKSIFVRRLAAQLAAAWLNPNNALDGWQSLVPLVITIRDLGPRLATLSLSEMSASKRQAALREVAMAQWQADLKLLGASALGAQLDALLDSGQVMLIFDGLDEISTRLRPLINHLIRAFNGYAAIPRIIVTCRVRSYPRSAGKPPLLPTFTVRTIAPFTRQQIRAFIDVWYQAVRISGDRMSRTADLQKAATTSHLIKLAGNPMLLTTMALIHQSRAELPRQRVRLYAEAVDVLLLRWQKVRGLAVESHLEKAYSIKMTQQLTMLLEDRERVRKILERLGYEAHLLLEPNADNADLARKDVINLLEKPAYLGSAGLAELFLDYVDHRAGLLVGQGGDDTEARPQQYRFPHRTFLEYLAGCYLVRDARIREIKSQYQKLVQEGNDWYVAAQLGAEELLHNDARKGDVLDLAYHLGRRRSLGTGTKQASWRSVVWAGYLAVQLGTTAFEDDVEYAGVERLNRLKADLLLTMQESPLPIRERAEAGRFLGLLGDPRDGVGFASLDGRKIPMIEWGGEVPAGDYSIGDGYGIHDDEAIRSVTISQAYQLSRYPITYAQFECFVGADDFNVAAWWDGLPDEERRVSEQTFKFDNHPRETVSWYQAIAFCRWLSDKLDMLIDLPHEHEWEVAARYPHNKRYPWGSDEFDALKANTSEGERVGQTTAAGMYPSGRNSELGLYDMSGNVLEWCRNEYNDVEAIQVDQSGESRTLRGGSWFFFHDAARVASRDFNIPDLRINDVGFRVCVRRPPSQEH